MKLKPRLRNLLAISKNYRRGQWAPCNKIMAMRSSKFNNSSPDNHRFKTLFNNNRDLVNLLELLTLQIIISQETSSITTDPKVVVLTLT
jgi:hypothetical protein